MLNNGNYFESLREKGSTKTAFDWRHKVQKEKKNVRLVCTHNYANKVASEGREKGKRSKASDSDCYFLAKKDFPFFQLLKREYKLTCITFFH